MAKKPVQKKKRPAKTAPTARAKKLPTMSGAAFIRQQPSGMTARQVVLEANKVGLNFSEGYVYTVRGQKTKRREREVANIPTLTPFPSSLPTLPMPSETDVSEVALRRIIANVGLARTKQVLDEMEKRFLG